MLVTITLNCFLVTFLVSAAIVLVTGLRDQEVSWVQAASPLALTPILIAVCYAMLSSGPL